MDRDDLKRLLRAVRAGKASVGDAVEQLRSDSIRTLDHTTLDLGRAVRRGFPEVVFGPGKTPDEIVDIVEQLTAAGQTAFVTRVGPEIHERVRAIEPRAEYHPLARAVVVRKRTRRVRRPGILVITAGTSDRPVAEEAALTAELMGNQVVRIRDVGVAGLHRLVEHRAALVKARVIVVVAGMEGALPSVVGGLTDCPVIGVPTSTGYGTGEGGRAALLTMLNSCVAGLTVVNIDNGMGAGYAAGLINQKTYNK
jgi:NCAIR mutase (PurE)-related protein